MVNCRFLMVLIGCSYLYGFSGRRGFFVVGSCCTVSSLVCLRSQPRDKVTGVGICMTTKEKKKEGKTTKTPGLTDLR